MHNMKCIITIGNTIITFSVHSPHRKKDVIRASHLAKERGLELCCGVAGVEKLTEGHLERITQRQCKGHRFPFYTYKCCGYLEYINFTSQAFYLTV